MYIAGSRSFFQLLVEINERCRYALFVRAKGLLCYFAARSMFYERGLAVVTRNGV